MKKKFTPLKIGDRVVYKCRHHSCSKKYKGEKGTVRRVGTIRELFPNEQPIGVLFDCRDDEDILGTFRINLELIYEDPDWEV